MLKRLSPRVHAFLGGVNCAVVEVGGGKALLVDSGRDREQGRKLRRALESLGLELSVILNTHSHADHYGGNAYLLRRYEAAEVWAPEIEAEIIRAPLLEPIYLFHGAKPPPELRSKWLMAEPSPVHRVVAAGEIDVGELRVELIDTRGHSHRQLAVLVDGVLLAADALFGAEVLGKHPFPFAQDVGGQLATLERLKGVAANVVLPGHGDPTRALQTLIERNERAVITASRAVLGAVRSAAEAGSSTEEVVARAGEELGAPLTDLPRYHLNFTTITAHLAHLRERGDLELHLGGGRLLWRPGAEAS